MKQIARLMSIAIIFAALSLPALAAERAAESPTFYGYNIGECKAIASVIGEVTATFLYYWDIAAQENRVATIMRVSYDLPPGYFGDVSKTRVSVTVKIIGSPGVLFASNHCKI